MPDWTAATADASAAERPTAFVVVRVPGSPDVMKEVALADIMTKDVNGNAAILNAALQAGNANTVLIGRQSSAFPTGSGKGFFEIRTNNNDATNGGISFYVLNAGAATEAMRIDYSKRVGIGTATSLYNLLTLGDDVNGSAVVGLSFSTTSTERGSITMAGGSGVMALKAGYSGYGGAFEFWTNGAARWGISTVGHLLPSADNAANVGSATFRAGTYFGVTGAINTSDERAKHDISVIPEDWLDAWSGVEWCRFKFTDGNRWHAGLIAQRVHAAFAARGLDAFDIGLCCYDEWTEVRRPIYATETRARVVQVPEYVPAGEDVDGQPLFSLEQVERTEEYEVQVDTGETELAQEAGDRWGLRYDECQAMEAAWQRREIRRLHARLAELEAR